jgi:hypothetical protein
MKLRVLLALFCACWLTHAAAQYGEGPGEERSRIYTGLWWNPDESGWGLNTTHQGNTVFATLFTYAADGQPLWLVASGLVGDDGTYSYTGPLYRTHGPPFNQVPWSPIGFGQVGTMTIAWTSPATATLTYSFEGATVVKTVTRQVYATPVPECVAVMGSRAAEANYQDLWWNPDESGWGINLVQQGGIIFATLFTYSESGRDKWFVASGLARQPDGSFTGALFSTTGPAFNASPWVPIGFGQVGDMTLRFSDGENGTLTYNVGSANVVKSIRRQVFGAITSACR